MITKAMIEDVSDRQKFFQEDKFLYREHLWGKVAKTDVPIELELGGHKISVTNSGDLLMPDGMTPAEAMSLFALIVSGRQVLPDPDCFMSQTAQKWAPNFIAKDKE
jgi:hypothetical protein